MNLYLVRHGKTGAKENNKKQAPITPLSEEGVKQAEAVAERLSKEKIDIIISSKWDRAYQTAEFISKKLNLELNIIDGVHEKEHNPIIYGVDRDSEVFKKFNEESETLGSNLDWKFEEKGESVRDLIKRTIIFQKHLINNYADKNVLVVSHGQFIRAFAIVSLLGSSYNDETFYKLYTSMSPSNTGITHFEYDSNRNHWELIYFNDHLHIR